jgi:hypothetical protein
MSNVTDLHARNSEARNQLLNRVPEPLADFDRDRMIADLPMILDAALDLILEDIVAAPGQTHSAAVGCRILAVTIDRLRLA